MAADTPTWARWNPAGAERPWTVGIEEEVLLLDALDGTAANRIGDVLAALPAGSPASAETHACVVEVRGRPHDTAGAAASELLDLRRQLDATLASLGLSGAVAGTHPSATWTEIEVAPRARYRRIRTSVGELARREPTCALHVHVAVPDGDAAIRALAGLRQDVPLLLALSANSPYWQGRDTGLASARTPVMSMFPRVGLPRRFQTYGEYVEAIDVLIRGRAIPDPSFVWWDLRLQPRLGTIEVRVMDGQTLAADTAAVAALVQCLVALHASAGPERPDLPPEVLDENRFLAARDGIAARLLTASGRRVVAAEALERHLTACGPLSRALGCETEIASGVRRLAADPGYARQRRIGSAAGLDAVVGEMARQFAVPQRPTVAVAR